METYETASGVVTQRVRVELEPDEAEAFARAHEHLAELIGGDEDWPIFTGLRRIAKAVAAKRETQPERKAHA